MTTPVDGVELAAGASATGPEQTRNLTDPGDATLRNFRYQHSYGVILLVGAKLGNRPYTAVWCEHHEDILAERVDGRFDAYQVKTSTPEGGAWTMTDADMTRSIGRFVDLVKMFGDRIASVTLVSNTRFDRVTPASTNAAKRAKCPEPFLEHIRACATPAEVAPPFAATFAALRASCGCEADALHRVLRRMDVIVGPSRDDFDAVIAHDHIGSLPECQGMDRDTLAAVRDRLVARIARASSLHVPDPVRHLRGLLEGVPTSGSLSTAPAVEAPSRAADVLPDPVLRTKRVPVDDIAIDVRRGGEIDSAPRSRERSDQVAGNLDRPGVGIERFQFTGPPAIMLGDARPVAARTVLRQKLQGGGFSEAEIEDLAEKERAAEAHLIASAHRWPEKYPARLRQLEGMVLGECREAYLRNAAPAGNTSRQFGTMMLIDVQDRLRTVSRDRPHMVDYEEYECLLGIAALLTGDCRVWWSERFALESDAA